MAVEKGTSVLEVLFSVGFGSSYALKRFVEDADNPVLFGKRRNGKCQGAELGCVESANSGSNFLSSKRRRIK
jgi:hypothetical protein